MATSVTSVINIKKPPYSGPVEAGLIGTHAHRCCEAMAKGTSMPDPISPEGMDCSDWFAQIQSLPMWDVIDVMASEYTMTRRIWSLGGQLDLLFRKDGQTVSLDLKSKSKSSASLSPTALGMTIGWTRSRDLKRRAVAITCC